MSVNSKREEMSKSHKKGSAKKVEKKSHLSKILTAEGWKNLLLGKFRKK